MTSPPEPAVEGYEPPPAAESVDRPAAQLPGEPSVVADVLLRVLGGGLAFAGGAVAAMLAVMLVPLRIGSFGWGDGGGIWAIRLPVAIAVAVVGNLFLVWFATHATGVRWAALLPGIAWFAVIVQAMRTTTDGDRLLLPDDWVGTLTLFGGTIVLVIATVLAVTQSRARTAYHRPS